MAFVHLFVSCQLLYKRIAATSMEHPFKKPQPRVNFVLPQVRPMFNRCMHPLRAPLVFRRKVVTAKPMLPRVNCLKGFEIMKKHRKVQSSLDAAYRVLLNQNITWLQGSGGTGICYDPRCLEHDFGAEHVEQPLRIKAIHQELQGLFRLILSRSPSRSIVHTGEKMTISNASIARRFRHSQALRHCASTRGHGR